MSKQNELVDGKIEVQIPFSGFYDSLHSDLVDREIEQYAEDLEEREEVPEEFNIWDVDINYGDVWREYAKAYIDAFATEFELDLEFTELSSPAFYNFGTDRVFAKIPKQQIDKIRKEVESYPEWAEVIKERFTSYDGFSSNYSNDINDEDWQKDILDECQYMVILEAWIEHNGKLNHVEYDESDLLEHIELYSFDSIGTIFNAIDDKVKEVKEANKAKL